MQGLVLVLAVAAGVRICVLLHTGPQSLDADEAVTGLMARRILHGQHFVYFAGQQYNGALAQYVQAAMYWALPLPQTPFTLRLPQVAIATITTWLVYVLTREVFTSHRVGLVAAGIYAIGPYWNVWLSTRSYGAYDIVQLLGVLGLLCALRGRNGRSGWVAAFGFCCGLTLWLGWSGFEVLVAGGIWLLPTLVASLRRTIVVLGAALTGAIPMVVSTLAGGGLTGAFGAGTQPHTTIGERLTLLFGTVAPEFLGLRFRSNQALLPSTAEHAAVVLVVAALFGAFVVRRRGIAAVITFRDNGHRRPVDLILLVFPATIALYGMSSYSWYAGTPRYLFALYPATSIIAAGGFTWVARWARRQHVGPISAPAVSSTAIFVLAGALVSATVLGIVDNKAKGNQQRYALTSDAQIEAADKWLLEHGYHAAYAQYWTAMPAEYFAPTGLHVAPTNIGKTKSPYARDQVDAAHRFAYLASNRVLVDYETPLRKALGDHHVHYQEIRLDGVTIFAALDPELRPAQLGLGS